METNLNITITTDNQAVEFLTSLHNDNLSFHPEDNAHDIVWNGSDYQPTTEDCDNLNRLMEEIYTNTAVDPCEILLDLINS